VHIRRIGVIRVHFLSELAGKRIWGPVGILPVSEPAGTGTHSEKSGQGMGVDSSIRLPHAAIAWFRNPQSI